MCLETRKPIFTRPALSTVSASPVTTPVAEAKLSSNVIPVDGAKTVTVTRNGNVVKVVTGRATGRKDTFTLTQSAAIALAAALQSA